MLIDWFTVFAQIANFLILMVLLKFLLYDKIVEVMDKRQESIQDELQQAEDTRKKAEEEKEQLAGQRREFENRKEQLYAEAKQEAKQHREQAREALRGEINELRQRWEQDLKREKSSFFHQLRELIGREIMAIGRTFFSELGEEQLQSRLVDRFASRLSELEEAEKNRFLEALKNNQDRVIVRSAYPLEEQEQQKLADEYQHAFGREDDFQYENTPELILGVEFETSGTKISLTLAHYFASLEERLLSLMEESSASAPDRSDHDDEEQSDA